MGERPSNCTKHSRFAVGLKILVVTGLLLAAACVPERAVVPNGGAQLVQDVTLAPTIAAPTRVLSATPSPIVIPVLTLETTSVLQVVTLESSFVLVTPTLPPSKTPSVTPTQTATYTPTAHPTATPNLVFATPIPIPSQLGGVVPLPTAIAVNPAAAGCATPWFFTQVIPVTCALNPPVTSPGSYQQFQNGFMVWVGPQHAIYVLYDSANFPRWQVLNDSFQDGMPESDPAYNNPPPYTWQPKRGFGLLWRNNASIRDRIGWAVTEYETPYTIQVQIASDGTIYMNEPRGGIFSLTPDGSEWKRYDG
jgi:hypothetical protein